jgi:hypothetical protein
MVTESYSNRYGSICWQQTRENHYYEYETLEETLKDKANFHGSNCELISWSIYECSLKHKGG